MIVSIGFSIRTNQPEAHTHFICFIELAATLAGKKYSNKSNLYMHNTKGNVTLVNICRIILFSIQNKSSASVCS